MIKLEYATNNSGGDWWLEDRDWYALEKAGWKVSWFKDLENYQVDRWLGGLARGAEKEFETPEQGVAEFQEITGQDAAALGCNCCGQPHNFSYEDSSGKTHYMHIETRTSPRWDI